MFYVRYVCVRVYVRCCVCVCVDACVCVCASPSSLRTQIVTPSPHRVKPLCAVQDKCGGCPIMFLDPKEQLKAKQQVRLRWVVCGVRYVCELLYLSWCAA